MAATSLPTLVFDTDTMPPGEGLRRWTELAQYDVALPPGRTPDEFRACQTAWRLNDMLVNAGLMGGCT